MKDSKRCLPEIISSERLSKKVIENRKEKGTEKEQKKQGKN